MGQRRHHQFQNKRNADKDDYRTVNPKQDNQRNRQQQHQKRPHYWREQRVSFHVCPQLISSTAICAPG